MAAEEEIQLWQTATPVEFVPRMKERNEAQSLLISTRQNPGYAVAAGQLGHAVENRATHLLMDFSQSSCAMRYQVDGAWEQIPPLDRETGDGMLQALKRLCQMNPADRRSSQTGELGLKLGKEKYNLKLQSQGVQTGERVLARIEAENIPFERLADLGMRDKMIATLKEKLNDEGNLILITAPKGEGLTTTWVTAVSAADRFVRDFQAIEHKDRPEPEIINVSANFFGGDTDVSQHERMQSMLLKEPDVVVFPELPEEDAFIAALDTVVKLDKQIYLRMVGEGAVTSLVALISRYGDAAKTIASRIGAVLSQKLVRRLCENCKVGFEPSPQLLKQLGIPPGRVPMLYQPFVLPPVEEQVDENGRPAPITPCHMCNGRGYFGRLAIFELLTPGDQLKSALLKTNDVSQLSKIAKTEGHRGIQAEAVLTVARGLTSIDELKRVFAKRG